jgi:hypothetical protein
MSTEYYANTVVGLRISSGKLKEYLTANKVDIEPYEFIERLNLESSNDNDGNYFITSSDTYMACIDVKHGCLSACGIPLLFKDDYEAIEKVIKQKLDDINKKMRWVGNLWNIDNFKIWVFGHTG